MATLLSRSALKVARQQTVCATSIAVQTCHSSTEPRIIKDPTTASLKRGTGGRSSFNGIVCTIFGASGFVGRYVSNQLCKSGTQMIIPYRGEHYHVLPMKLSADLGQMIFQEFHLKDEESIHKCIKYSNVVINLIGKEFETKNYSYKDVNVDWARRLARICKESGNVERLIHVSCLSAEAKPTPLVLSHPSKYLTSKWEGECAVREEFPEATIVRPSDIYGQGDRFVRCYTHFKWRHMSRIPLYKSGLETEKQPVWVGDVARGIDAIVKDYKTAGKTYQFVGPDRYLFKDLVQWWTQILYPDLELPQPFTTDIMTAYGQWLKVYLLESLTLTSSNTHIHWEKIEKDSRSDKILKNLPRLEDLGITPRRMADRMEWEVQPFRNYVDIPDRAAEYLRASNPTPLTPH